MWGWVVITLGAIAALAFLYDTVRFRRSRHQVLELLQAHGPLTGLELADLGVPRAHIYLVLRVLEDEDVVEWLYPNHRRYQGQKAYRVKRS